MYLRKIRDLIDYCEGALDVIDGKSVKPEPLSEGANDAAIKDHRTKSDFYRKANSYAKSMITSAVTDTVYQTIMDKETAHEPWEGEDVSTHVAKLTSLWNELNNVLKAKGETVIPDLILMIRKQLMNEKNNCPCLAEISQSSDKIEQEALVVKSESDPRGRYYEKWIGYGSTAKNTTVQKNMDKTVVTNVALFTISGEVCLLEVGVYNWWTQNGATKHMTNSSDYFVSFEAFNNPCCIKAPGQESLEKTGRGSVRIQSTVDSRCEELTLTDNAEFKPLVPEKGATANISLEDRFDVLQLYHESCSHRDKYHVTPKLKKEFKIDVKEGAEIYEPCRFGKVHRTPFGTREKSTRPAELISTDLCGHFYKSFQKKCYLVLFKDNYTKFHYCYFGVEKSELSKILKDFFSHTKALEYSVKEMLSDNGKKFVDKEIISILSSNGITQRLTAPCTPKQNGICKQDTRTVVEMARTLKYSNPYVIYLEQIWAELVNTAIYILNRTGKSSVEGVSSYELWERKRP
ncbi:uncharacterized protein LOC126452302 [Schistocerca serialis cubense]|uniref:uncharacterized protein LOC126452302 n=1 Tax=Schistocerca serialis cubense TaxID=2023355 RepID=UPI00214EF124|nr:uncharacterized protein LOC126452302 [Schistocerca serialis cubense]